MQSERLFWSVIILYYTVYYTYADHKDIKNSHPAFKHLDLNRPSYYSRIEVTDKQIFIIINAYTYLIELDVSDCLAYSETIIVHWYACVWNYFDWSIRLDYSHCDWTLSVHLICMHNNREFEKKKNHKKGNLIFKDFFCEFYSQIF